MKAFLGHQRIENEQKEKKTKQMLLLMATFHFSFPAKQRQQSVARRQQRKMILQPSHLGQLGISISLWLHGRHQMQHGPAYLGFAI